jgi:lysophospholipase L1-like esterase
MLPGATAGAAGSRERCRVCRVARLVGGRLLLVVLGLAAGLLLAEAALRVWPVPNRFVLQEQLAACLQSDGELLLHLRPTLRRRITGHPEFRFSVVTSAEGLRDDSMRMDQSIVAIGDSFTLGFGVEGTEAWPKRLEALSGQRVANLGFNGWNSYVYPATIRRHAAPRRARLWLWGFFINDLMESAGAEAFIRSGRQDYRPFVTDVTGLSARVRATLLRLRTAQLLAAWREPDYFLPADSGSGIYDDGQLRIRYGTYPWDVSDPTRPEVRRGWELTEAALREGQRLAAANGARLVVFFFPSREHVYWPYLRAVMRNADVRQLDDVEARLASFCRSQGIAYLDLLPALREAGMRKAVLYFPNDGHWNAAGHDLAARTIATFLRDARLIP